MSQTTHHTVIAFVVGTAIACGAARVSTDGAIQPASYDQQTECAPAQFPEQVPAVAQVLDSGALLIQLAQYDAARGASVLGVRFDADGAPVPARVLESPLPQRAADSLAALLTARLRAQTPGSVWGVRVRIRHGAPRDLSIERSVFCPPRQVPGTTRLPVVVSASRPEPARIPPRLVVLVDPTGRVADVRIIHSSGDSRLDRSHADAARQRRFEPARLDGAAVPAWFQIDFSR